LNYSSKYLEILKRLAGSNHIIQIPASNPDYSYYEELRDANKINGTSTSSYMLAISITLEGRLFIDELNKNSLSHKLAVCALNSSQFLIGALVGGLMPFVIKVLCKHFGVE
jgi:hypothetical protein